MVDREDSDSLGCGRGRVDPESSYGGGSECDVASVCGLSGSSKVTLLFRNEDVFLMLFARNRRVDKELR